MGQRIIDLSLTIDPACNYIQFPRSTVYGRPEPATTIETVSDINEVNIFVCKFSMTTQSFTHYDAPAHYIKGGLKNDEVPLETLIGEGPVIDMMHKAPNEGVTAEDLEKSGAEIRPGDIAMIRTGWTDRAWGTRQFWEEMIYLSTDACQWLIQRKIKALAQDFMTCDPPLNPPPDRRWPAPRWSPNHLDFLGAGIPLIEWLTNMGSITQPRVTLICLPIKLKGTDGAPCRVIAIEDD